MIGTHARRYYRTPKEEIRKSWLLIGLMVQLIGGVVPMVLFDLSFDPTFWVAGFIIGIVAACIPTILRIPHTLWMLFAEGLGWFNTRLILGALFFGVFTPISFLFRMIGRDALARSPDPRATTYRTVVDPKERKEPMKDPF